jgi:hypothetical protein
MSLFFITIALCVYARCAAGFVVSFTHSYLSHNGNWSHRKGLVTTVNIEHRRWLHRKGNVKITLRSNFVLLKVQILEIK